MSIELFGIDVSVFQGDIDWNKVKAAGKQFAMIRLGYCGYNGGIVANGGLDKKFEQNIKGALAAGLPVGVYVYSYATTADAAAAAAKETLELIRPYRLEYPIAFDIEDSLYLNKTKAENTAVAKAFLSAIEQENYYAILYSYKSFLQTNLEMSRLSAHDVWVAQYAAKNTYTGAYGMWQYAGDTGTVDGVTGPCDLDVAYRDYPVIIAAAGLNNLAQEQPGNEPEPEPEPDGNGQECDCTCDCHK